MKQVFILLCSLCLSLSSMGQQRMQVVIDNDFAGDPDGLFALAQLMTSTSVDTQFEYGKPCLSAKEMHQNTVSDSIVVSVDVKNVGKREGKEVVQLYIGDDQCSVLRPVKELKHFQKISLSAGEKQTVSFVIKEDDLKFYDEGWKTEPGSFTLYVGSSSVDIRGKAKFTLLGNK